MKVKVTRDHWTGGWERWVLSLGGKWVLFGRYSSRATAERGDGNLPWNGVRAPEREPRGEPGIRAAAD